MVTIPTPNNPPLITQGHPIPSLGVNIHSFDDQQCCVLCKQYAGLAHTGYMILSETWPPPSHIELALIIHGHTIYLCKICWFKKLKDRDCLVVSSFDCGTPLKSQQQIEGGFLGREVHRGFVLVSPKQSFTGATTATGLAANLCTGATESNQRNTFWQNHNSKSVLSHKNGRLKYKTSPEESLNVIAGRQKAILRHSLEKDRLCDCSFQCPKVMICYNSSFQCSTMLMNDVLQCGQIDDGFMLQPPVCGQKCNHCCGQYILYTLFIWPCCRVLHSGGPISVLICCKFGPVCPLPVQ